MSAQTTTHPRPTHAELMQQLQAPFPPELVKTKAADGRLLSYSEVWVYQQRLDDVFGFNWTARTDRLEDGDCRCTITVTLDDEYQTTVSREAYGQRNNAFGGAEAQAFKRACAAFGIGRFLYALPTPPAAPKASTAQTLRIEELCRKLYGEEWQAKMHAGLHARTNGSRPLAQSEAEEIIASLSEMTEAIVDEA